MARIRTYNVTIGTAATPVVSGAHVPVQEVHVSPTTNTIYLGDSSVTSANYGRKIDATDAPVILANGPAGLAAFNLNDLYIAGTSGDVVHVLAVTL